MKKILSLIVFCFFLDAAVEEGSITVNGEMLEVKVSTTYSPQPSYPRSALRRGIEGYVIVEFDVSPDGAVLDPFVVETDQPGSFERAALRSVRRWAFEPYVHEGMPVTVSDVTTTFRFRLAD